MTAPSNNMEILKLLPKTNCKDCNMPTCLAFAVEVVRGKKTLADCPHLAPEVVEQYQGRPAKTDQIEEELQQKLEQLRSEVSQVDFEAVAPKLGARLTKDGLAIPTLGTDFMVDFSGLVTSRCHVIPWVHIPLLQYIITCQGVEPTGEWLPMRDLRGGMEWGQFFEHRTEVPLKKVIDGYLDLFKIMFDVFGAQQAEAFDSDIAVVLHPLPKVPMLICYWQAEDGMDSDLHMFWDATAPDNLMVDALYFLGAGMVTMFEKIAQTHGE